jgi:hypothetical protein
MAAVFWLALQMFRVVLRAQIEAKNRAMVRPAPTDHSS